MTDGLLIGALLAVAICSWIALLQLHSGAPWQDLLKAWGKMLVLTIPACAATTAAALMAWRYRRKFPDEAPVITKASPQRVLSTEQSLAEAVVQNARDQASWHYEYGSPEPTRRAFEGEGVSQTIWNSSRHILTTAKIVSGKEWSPEPWIVIEAALDNIHAEHDRVWVRPLGEHKMVCLHIDERARNKRYTHPTPPVEEPEGRQNQPEPGGSTGSWEPEQEVY